MFRIVIYLVTWVLVINVTAEPIQAKQKRVIRPSLYASGETKTGDDLATILLEHKKWIETHGQQGQRANLTGADLEGANLSGADLREAELINANLREADLSEADLSGADLREAELINANLREADLSEANLIGAFLTGAELSGAKLRKANLTSATLLRANLTSAVLQESILNETNLREANLTLAYLQEAKLRKADLGNAILRETDLVKADLREANLTLAYLQAAKLMGANLSNAILKKANLNKANVTESYLTEANLEGADLSGATLKKVKLKDANLTDTNLQGSYFEPENFEGLLFLGAKGLSTIEFERFTPIVSLRNIAKDCGFRNEERALTAALRKHRLIKTPMYERIFEYMLVDFPTDSGANPWRSLISLFLSIILFSLIYARSLKRDGEDGIWRVWIVDRVRKDLGSEEPIRLTVAGFNRIKGAFYFSVFSAFSIGWRELDLSYWIARLQRREFVLRPTGWIRTVSGFQSLISLYFLALWAITYFGRPFE